MIEAILKIPDEVLNSNLSESTDSNKLDKTRVIIVFLDDEFEIQDVEIHTYAEWKNSDKISQKQIQLLDCQRFIAPVGIRPSRKGFGGQYGLSTCSPLHIKLTETYIQALLNKTDLKKIDAFANSLKESALFTFSNRLIMAIRLFFKEATYASNEKLNNLSFRNWQVDVKKNDYLIFLAKERYIEEFILSYNKFIEQINSRTINIQKGRCFICRNTGELDVFPYGNFEGEQQKHNQLFHKFNKVVNYYPNALVCKECIAKIEKFFKIVTKRTLFRVPIPLNIRNSSLTTKNLIFDEEKKHKLLEKLKEIYEDNNSEPFDYVLFSCSINNQGINDYQFEYIPNFNYKFKQNDVGCLKFNDYLDKSKVKKQIIVGNLTSDKSILVRDINEIFLPKYAMASKFFEDAGDIKKMDAFIKLKFLQYREQIINFVFKNDSHFLDYAIKNLIEEILLNVTKNKELKEYYSNPFNLKRLLLHYYKYELKKAKNMKYKSLIDMEKKVDDITKQYQSDKEVIIDVKNDFEAAYIAGQIFHYLLNQSKSGKEELDLLGTYLLGVHNFEQIKEKILDLTQRYRHEIINTKLWSKFNEALLGYQFEDNSVRGNIVAFYTGVYANNIFYTKKKV